MTIVLKGKEFSVSDKVTKNGMGLLIKAAKFLEGMKNSEGLNEVQSPLVAASIIEGPGIKQVGLFLENGSWVWIKN